MCSNSSGDRPVQQPEVRRACAQADDPLMLRMLRGEKVDRPPVWMMRQAGRYMKVYQDLCKKHKTFRERSENVDLAVQTRPRLRTTCVVHKYDHPVQSISAAVCVCR